MMLIGLANLLAVNLNKVSIDTRKENYVETGIEGNTDKD